MFLCTGPGSEARFSAMGFSGVLSEQTASLLQLISYSGTTGKLPARKVQHKGARNHQCGHALSQDSIGNRSIPSLALIAPKFAVKRKSVAEQTRVLPRSAS